MNKPTTDDEVLALAEKIKRQRVVDEQYSRVSQQLSHLKFKLDNDAKYDFPPQVCELFLKFGTNQVGRGYNDRFSGAPSSAVNVYLPPEAADDLIQFLQNYIAEKEDI